MSAGIPRWAEAYPHAVQYPPMGVARSDEMRTWVRKTFGHVHYVLYPDDCIAALVLPRVIYVAFDRLPRPAYRFRQPEDAAHFALMWGLDGG